MGVGRALSAALDVGLRRDELFVTTKLFPGNPAARRGLPLPAANQIEPHPWSQKRELVDHLRDNGIGVIDLFSFTLGDQDMAGIAQMERGTAVAWAIGDPTSVA